IGLASWWLAGAEGMSRLISLWMGYVEAMPTNYPESMMNFRSLMVFASPIVGTTGAIVATIAAMAVTAVAGVWVWVRHPGPDDALRSGAGTYAASSAVSWHAHVHLALPLMALLMAGSPWIPRRRAVVSLMVLAPSLAFALAALLVDAGFAHRLAGWSFLAVNLTVLGNSIHGSRSPTLGSASELGPKVGSCAPGEGD
ncbi:MAG TPA: hypothetical protein VLL77_12530, partial [Anaerolineales bacterium]|nr:hypothetical protein [Anaerolineales bacterium]